MKANLFQNGDDLPLFSGTPVRVTEPDPAKPSNDAAQQKMVECPICFDTGIVQVKGHLRRCWCRIGEQAAVREALLNRTSKRLARVQRNAPDAYPEISTPNDTERVLKEVAVIESLAKRFDTVGADNLSIVELLSIVLGEQTPILASRILVQFPTLARIMNATPNHLASVKGMTPRRVMLLQSALQLAHRQEHVDRPTIKTPADCVEIVGPMMRGLENEQMRVLALDTKNHIKSNALVYQGSVHTTVIRVGELLRDALMVNASGVIVLHSHPSGDPTPSPEDVAVTREIAQAAKLLDLDLLDHIVIGDPGFVSLKERGLGFG
jgi:DNA repair protein RadC